MPFPLNARRNSVRRKSVDFKWLFKGGDAEPGSQEQPINPEEIKRPDPPTPNRSMEMTRLANSPLKTRKSLDFSRLFNKHKKPAKRTPIDISDPAFIHTSNEAISAAELEHIFRTHRLAQLAEDEETIGATTDARIGAFLDNLDEADKPAMPQLDEGEAEDGRNMPEEDKHEEAAAEHGGHDDDADNDSFPDGISEGSVHSVRFMSISRPGVPALVDAVGPAPAGPASSSSAYSFGGMGGSSVAAYSASPPYTPFTPTSFFGGSDGAMDDC